MAFDFRPVTDEREVQAFLARIPLVVDRERFTRFLLGFPHHYLYSFSRGGRHPSWPRDWSSDVCSSDLGAVARRGLSSRAGYESLRMRRVTALQSACAPRHVSIGQDRRRKRGSSALSCLAGRDSGVAATSSS